MLKLLAVTALWLPVTCSSEVFSVSQSLHNKDWTVISSFPLPLPLPLLLHTTFTSSFSVYFHSSQISSCLSDMMWCENASIIVSLSVSLSIACFCPVSISYQSSNTTDASWLRFYLKPPSLQTIHLIPVTMVSLVLRSRFIAWLQRSSSTVSLKTSFQRNMLSWLKGPVSLDNSDWY